MQFIEETLEFSTPLRLEQSSLIKSLSIEALPTLNRLTGDTQMAGITVRLGNQPIVHSLRKILELSNANIPPEIEVLFEKKNIYSIVHTIGAIRVDGSAEVDELQYHAKVINIDNAQTIDLIPSTKFKEALKASVTIEGSMSATGNVSAKLPAELINSLLPKYLSLGGDMQIQLSTNASFIGKFNFSVKFPVTQSLGIASDHCSWILNPDEDKTPLLGDQLLIQIIAVPKDTIELQYNVFGVVKVDRGIFYAQEEKKTGEYQFAVVL